MTSAYASSLEPPGPHGPFCAVGPDGGLTIIDCHVSAGLTEESEYHSAKPAPLV